MNTAQPCLVGKTRLFPCLTAAAVCLFAFGSSATPEELSGFDRFTLWNDCRPIGLFVPPLTEDAGDIGLEISDIKTSVRSRLRAARIYSDSSSRQLLVTAHVVGLAFNVELEFFKFVVDKATEEQWYAVTWETGSTGTHGRNPSFILPSIARHTDKFLDEYLRVNADACGS